MSTKAFQCCYPNQSNITTCLHKLLTMRSCLFCYITAFVITLFFLSPNFERQLGIDSKMMISISQRHCPFLSPKQLCSCTHSPCLSLMPPGALLPPASDSVHLQPSLGIVVRLDQGQVRAGKTTYWSFEYNSDNIGASWLIPQ